MMKRKILAAALALCMLLSMSTAALAADDGNAATAPVGGGEGASSGAATVGDSFDVTGDDDATAADAEDTGADISLWGRITGGADGAAKIYKLDVAWGDMYFVYEFDGQEWNTGTYEYEDGSGGSWSYDFVTGRNNGITVTNHSNDAVSASFEFTMERNAGNDGTVFNKDVVSPDINEYAVVGNFFRDSAKAEFASQIKTRTYGYDGNPVGIDGAMSAGDKLVLPTADAYYETPGDSTPLRQADARVGNVYFAFSGTPDRGGFFTKSVGTITITFAPGSAQQPGG